MLWTKVAWALDGLGAAPITEWYDNWCNYCSLSLTTAKGHDPQYDRKLSETWLYKMKWLLMTLLTESSLNNKLNPWKASPVVLSTATGCLLSLWRFETCSEHVRKLSKTYIYIGVRWWFSLDIRVFSTASSWLIKIQPKHGRKSDANRNIKYHNSLYIYKSEKVTISKIPN